MILIVKLHYNTRIDEETRVFVNYSFRLNDLPMGAPPQSIHFWRFWCYEATSQVSHSRILGKNSGFEHVITTKERADVDFLQRLPFSLDHCGTPFSSLIPDSP